MAEPARNTAPGEAPSRIRPGAAVFMGAALVFACISATHLEFKARSAHMAMSNLPLAVLVPFVFGLLGNAALKRIWPAVAMRTHELRVFLCVLWPRLRCGAPASVRRCSSLYSRVVVDAIWFPEGGHYIHGY